MNESPLSHPPPAPRRINFGCGSDYRPGWLNVDVAEESKWRDETRKPDLLISAEAETLPLADGSADYILADNVLEHVERRRVHGLLMEFHRILAPGGVLEIWVPHFKGILVKYIEHVRGYGINLFWFYARYFEIRQELLLVTRSRCAVHRWARPINALNPLFNWSTTVQQFCEKFMPGGFEEIHYVMRKRAPRD